MACNSLFCYDKYSSRKTKNKNIGGNRDEKCKRRKNTDGSRTEESVRKCNFVSWSGSCMLYHITLIVRDKDEKNKKNNNH